MKILNAEAMRKSLVGKVKNVRIYNGRAMENLSAKEASVAVDEPIKITNESWKDSAGREELIRERVKLENDLRVKLENDSTGEDMKTIQKLAALYTIDLVRQADDYTDYTPILFKEVVDEGMPESVILRDVMPYVGKEETITGSGDKVPLMQPALPVDVTAQLEIRGFGDMTTMRQLVFNPFHKTELIIESAARILADEKNKDSFGPILGNTFTSAHQQAADTTGTTYDLQLYNTLKKGAKKALGLICKPYGKEVGLIKHEMYLLINPMDELDVLPIVNGALQGIGGIQQMTAKIPFDGVIPYGCGINHGMKYGSEELKYPGVPRGKAYIFVKVENFGGYRLVKRNETMEVGAGDILGLTSEKRAWHRIRGIYSDWIKPSVESGKSYGAVIEVILPTET